MSQCMGLTGSSRSLIQIILDSCNPPRQDSEQAVNPTSFHLYTLESKSKSSRWWGTSFCTLWIKGAVMGSCMIFPLAPSWHSPEKQISVVGGLGPGHSWSGSTATVLENSRKILHWTWRSLMPSPQGELHGPHSSTMKLQEEKTSEMSIKNPLHFLNWHALYEEHFLV